LPKKNLHGITGEAEANKTTSLDEIRHLLLPAIIWCQGHLGLIDSGQGNSDRLEIATPGIPNRTSSKDGSSVDLDTGCRVCLFPRSAINVKCRLNQGQEFTAPERALMLVTIPPVTLTPDVTHVSFRYAHW
jgi:hypothetical protein